MKLVLLVLALAFPLTQASAAQLVTDKASGCKIVDEEAAPDHTVRWSGPCSGGIAEGNGAAEFLAGNNVIRRVEASFSKGVAIGQIKVTRYKNGAISTVTEFARGNGADETVQKVSFYRDGAVTSIESGQWSGGKLNGSCSVERYAGGKIVKSSSGACANGAPAGPAKVRFYASSPSHDLLYEGLYLNGKLEGQGESSELLAAAPALPAESCLRIGDVTWHYVGEWKANLMNGQGTIESHFCAATPDGVVHHIDMKAAGSWIDSGQDGETVAEYATDGGAPTKIKRVYDHGALVSEALADPPAPPAGTPPAKKDGAESREAVCRNMPWLCNEHTFDAAPFAKVQVNR